MPLPDQQDAHPIGDSSVDSLLGFDLDDDTWLERVREYSAPPVFGRIGDYELLDEIGRGGQGVVFKARQPRTGREIAVKRLSAGAFATPEMRARFEREIEAAVALDHLNIVTVFGTEVVDGQQLLAMKWVDGVPIDRWARPPHGASRPTRDILEVFTVVCDAVHHAHQRGVIHRDLKPSNILVDKENRPFVLDFGLAKVARETGPTAAITMTGQFLGTPAFAAPEQIRGDVRSIDVRTDVYALGAILYRLLTGFSPFDDTGDLPALMQNVLHREPLRPSSHDANLNRELDVILLKALAKDKDQRYASVDALADDLRRFLTGQAVLAHPPSTVYQVRKFVRQHRGAVATTAAVAVLLVAATVVSTLSFFRAERERRRADAALLAEREQFAEAQRQQEERAAAQRRADEARAAEEKAVELRKQGERFAYGMEIFFWAVFKTGSTEYAGRSDVTLRDALTKGIAQLDFGTLGPLELETKIRQMAGYALTQWGDFEVAEPQLVRSLEIQRELPDASPDARARAANILAGLYFDRRAFDKAEPLYREVLDLAPQFAVGDNRWILGTAMNDVAVTLLEKGEPEKAADFFWQARAIYSEQFGGTDRRTLQATYNLANCLAALGENAEALAWHEEILSLRRQYLGDDLHVARSLERISEFHMKNGRATDAEPLLREAADIIRRLSGAEHAHYGRVLTKLGKAIAALDRLAEAETVLREALSICRLKLSPDAPDVREAADALCGILERQDKRDEARQIRTEFEVPER